MMLKRFSTKAFLNNHVFNSRLKEFIETIEWNPGGSFHKRAAPTEKDLSP